LFSRTAESSFCCFRKSKTRGQPPTQNKSLIRAGTKTTKLFLKYDLESHVAATLQQPYIKERLPLSSEAGTYFPPETNTKRKNK